MQHGIEYLLETQRADGSWDEELATGTGFPKVFYLNYHLYKLFPAARAGNRSEGSGEAFVTRTPANMTHGRTGWSS